MRQANPNGNGSNPIFKHSVTIGAVVDDPDIIMEWTGGGGAPAAKHTQHAAKKQAAKKKGGQASKKK